MVEKAEGYLTHDGKFFQEKGQADMHEALSDLKVALKDAGVKDVESAINLIGMCRHQIGRFLEAYAPVEQAVEDKEEAEYEIDESGFGIGDGNELGIEQGDDHISQEIVGEPEEEATTIQPLPPGVREPMPDLGGRIQPTKVRHERPVNGPRSRGGNAPGIRRR